jgi:hypothetical protein
MSKLVTRTSIALMGRRTVRRTKSLRLPSFKGADVPDHLRTKRVYVSSPTVPGTREEVSLVVDTIEMMWRGKWLNENQYRAAQIFRSACDTLASCMGGTMDFERSRGASVPGQPPLPPNLAASEKITDAKQALSPMDYDIVCKIVGYGFTVKAAAGMIDRSARTVGKHLRDALSLLADRWTFDAVAQIARSMRRPRIYSHRDFDARDRNYTISRILTQARIASADRRGVHWSDEKGKNRKRS